MGVREKTKTNAHTHPGFGPTLRQEHSHPPTHFEKHTQARTRSSLSPSPALFLASVSVVALYLLSVHPRGQETRRQHSRAAKEEEEGKNIDLWILVSANNQKMSCFLSVVELRAAVPDGCKKPRSGIKTRHGRGRDVDGEEQGFQEPLERPLFLFQKPRGTEIEC